MRYLPKSPADREAMLAEIGVGSIDDLFATIPAEFQLKRDLAIPRQHGESEIIERFRGHADNNANGYAGFLGAGVIMKDGGTIKGLNTAATLWCSAAVGAFSGAGLPAEAAILAGFVLAANTLLRPLVQW